MNKDNQVALYAMIDVKLHAKLKAYAALSQQSMAQAVETWIETLSFE
jgi:hypothetical protein